MKQKSFQSQLDKCVCGYTGKLKASLLFGYLTLVCPECGRKLTGETRSGNIEYILEHDLLERWNNGEENNN